MTRETNNAELHERVYKMFSEINFNSFDYNSIKESLIDHMKLYFSEDFDDYIESSEFIAILELFAYIGELLYYRVDVNAHENFITTAQRRESVLRLAKLISYTPTRNVPNRGLVKITSVQTTDTIFDSQSRNLSGRTVLWNDPNNSDWKEQFLLIMNRVLVQEFGTVVPSDRVQVNNVLLELYTLNNNPLASTAGTTFPYSVNVTGQILPMELVPSTLTESGPVEKRPEVNAQFTTIYSNDGLGDGSDTTGFLMFTKQGRLNKTQQIFDGITPNQTLDITVPNINDTDVYVNNVDADSRQIITHDPFANTFPHISEKDNRFGEWSEQESDNGQNVLFNTTSTRNKYEVETLDKDQVRLIFGDGEFANIPSGAFDIWYRTSVNEDITIPRNSVTNQTASFSYTDPVGNVQTITFTFSLINSLQNGSASETTEHIRRVAPSVYYSQNRMVNGRDYNSLPLQDPSILRLKAVNRTFSGDSRYIKWHDPRGSYEDVKIFGNDLALYWEEKHPTSGQITTTSEQETSNVLLTNVITPLLSGSDFFALVAPYHQVYNSGPSALRRRFTVIETSNIIAALDQAQNGEQPFVDLYYSISKSNLDGTWHVNPQQVDIDFIHFIRIEAVFSGGTPSGWIVNNRTKRMVAYSNSTKFWNSTSGDDSANAGTLNKADDKIVVLQANVTADNNILDSDQVFNILGQRVISQNLPNGGLPDLNSLLVLPTDANGDGIPDDVITTDLFGDFTDGTDVIEQTHVYFKRESTSSPWIPQKRTQEIEQLVQVDSARSDSERLYKRETGRFPLNFAWLHSSPNLNLIDPAASNIIDMYVVTTAYYNNLRSFISNKTDVKPRLPTPHELQTSYSHLLANKMISDTVILHPGRFQILFGSSAEPQLRAVFKIVRPAFTTITDNEVKVRVVDIVREFFDIKYWEMGETFFFTELAAAIHAKLSTEIDSVVLVPLVSNTQFGDMFQLQSGDDQLFIPDIKPSNIEIVDRLTPQNINQ